MSKPVVIEHFKCQCVETNHFTKKLQQFIFPFGMKKNVDFSKP